MDSILRDLRYASRRLRRYPGFTLIAVLSLALGIGANTAIFSLVEAVLMRDTGVREPDRVMEIYLTHPQFSYAPFSTPDFRELERATPHVFESMFGSALTFVPRDLGDRVESLPAEMVTGNYFRTMGLQPAAGRLLSAEDDVTPGGHAVVVLAYDYWRREFNGERSAVGQQLRINGRNYEIVGVAPANYDGNLRGLAPALYVPLMMINQLQPGGYDQLDSRGDHSTFVRARLKAGVTRAQADAVLATFARDMTARYPQEWPSNGQLKTIMLSDLIVNPMLDKFILLAATLLSVVVGLVLLIACANLASFLLAQARDRQREIAIRLSIGAERNVLVRQLLTESIALALVGGVLAIALAKGLLSLLLNADLPLPLPVTVEAALNTRVLLFALAVTVVAGVLFGLMPALQATRTDVMATIKNENTGGPARRVSMRDVLVTGQVAISLVLLLTAGLFLRSLSARATIDPGFGKQPTAFVQFNIPAERYNEAEARLLVQRLEERVSQIQGVQAVGITGNLHLNTLSTQNVSVKVDGVAPPKGQDAHIVDYTRVDPGFFSTFGIGLLQGRNFDNAIDRADAPRVAIVNQNFVDQYFRGQNALGRSFMLDDQPHTIVGIASNAKIRSLGEAPRAFVYVPFAQRHSYFLTMAARTSGNAEQLAPQLLAAVRAVEPDLIVFEVKTLARHMAVMLLPARLAAVIFGTFAGLALILALVGVYGVVSYAVARRVREVGIRLSLGAQPSEVVRLLMRHGLTLIGIGTVMGLALALLGSSALRAALYGVEPIDPLTFAVAPVLLALVGVVATWVPARRASRIDPARVLKAE